MLSAASAEGEPVDAQLVEVFVEEVLAAEGIRFRHGDDADFEAELEVERGTRDLGRRPVAALPAVSRSC